MEKSKSSYLLEDIDEYDFDLPLQEYRNTDEDLIHIPNFLSADELLPYENVIKDIRKYVNLSMLPIQSVGNIAHNDDDYKYICHHRGRYDIWNIASKIKKPSLKILENFTQKSIGCLLLDANTPIDGKYHKDTVELFDKMPNSRFPPFYYNMLVATCDQTELNGPTTFVIDDELWWVKLKRGDALIFNGELIHRGIKNMTNTHRDMIYTVFTKKWYDEEIL
jgi:hypothetical protein